jgi:hypothetical protein
MQGLHDGNAAPAASGSLKTDVDSATYRPERGDETFSPNSYLPVGLWPSFLLGLFFFRDKKLVTA